jgi:hypothetical protein
MEVAKNGCTGEGMGIELDEWHGVKRSGCERRDVGKFLPGYSPFPFITPSSILPLNFTTHRIMAAVLTRAGLGRFTIPNAPQDGDLLIVWDMVCVYLEHDRHLRAWTTTTWRLTPAGCDDFARALNFIISGGSVGYRLAEEGISSSGPRITGPSPSFTDLVGTDDNLVTPPPAP